ncbi:unnamed protein product [Linum trigynum]|uniref:Uncharacterized protein n=1 Tax=Linum trigynum TaxID=586398 RepID=A0AAV2F2A1_9ROSI
MSAAAAATALSPTLRLSSPLQPSCCRALRLPAPPCPSHRSHRGLLLPPSRYHPLPVATLQSPFVSHHHCRHEVTASLMPPPFLIPDFFSISVIFHISDLAFLR